MKKVYCFKRFLNFLRSQLRDDDDDNNNNEGKFFERKLEDYKEGEKIFCFVKTVRLRRVKFVYCQEVAIFRASLLKQGQKAQT